MKQKNNTNYETLAKERQDRLNHILDRLQGTELFKKSNDIAREQLKKMKVVAKDL